MTDLSNALKEAYASAPTDMVVLNTLHFDHANFTQPFRVVNDNVDLTARDENNREVKYLAYPFNFTPPELGDTAAPKITIEIDNISKDIIDQLGFAVDSDSDISITWRQYLSTDKTKPQNNPPLKLNVISVEADLTTIQITAGFFDFTNTAFPSKGYTLNQFPGLLQ